MKNIISKKIDKINLNLLQKHIIEKPLKVLKKLNIVKIKKITSFSLNKSFDNFKQKIKQAELKKIEIQKKESIKEAKKKKIELKKKKLEEAKKIKNDQLQKLNAEKKRLALLIMDLVKIQAS